MPSPRLRRAIRDRLLDWFATHQRDLPWRRSRDPYRIWVSEIMLQQTQVATVVPYFERFVQAFPTLACLAAAEEHDVLRRWEGLGYYRRARSLHLAARQLASEHGSMVPNDPEVLSELPGMGRYTVGAVLSQAFERPTPILEANSQRVLCRLFGRDEDPRKGTARRRLWELAKSLLPKRRVGDFNQALMELGALVCTPAAPKCSACPLADKCVAQQQGLQEQIPVKVAPPRIVAVEEVAVVVRREGQVLLVKRPDTGRWAGLWEFPHGPLQKGEAHEDAVPRLLAELTGLQAERGPEILTVRHGVTRYRITMVCFDAEYRCGVFRSTLYPQAVWVAPAKLGSYAVSAPQRRLARAIVGSARQRRLF